MTSTRAGTALAAYRYRVLTGNHSVRSDCFSTKPTRLFEVADGIHDGSLTAVAPRIIFSMPA
jgi:hypothetical protein